jgi:hypothetical protein
MEMESLEGRMVLSATSAVSFVTNGVAHHALYAIAANDTVEVSTDGGPFVNLGGYAKQISAGLDALGRPEVYEIDAHNAVEVTHGPGTGWTNLGGYAKQISATVANTFYVIGTNDAVFINRGAGYTSLGSYAQQISAGADAAGNPEVYEIDGSNAVEVNRGAGFKSLGGYAKQISATMNDAVFVIGSDNSVFRNTGSGSGYVPLGGYAKQISAGLDALGKPEVFAIGLDDALYVNHGTGFTTLGGFVTEVAAPGVSIALPGDVAYVVNVGHSAALHRGTSFLPIGGYVQTLSGSTSDNTSSWAPATRDISAISFVTNGVAHHALYAIAANDTVEVSTDGGPFVNLGGYAKQISAGLDNAGRPEVYSIDAHNAVEVNHGPGTGWTNLGGYAKQISATVANTVYVIGTNDAVFLNRGAGYVPLGSYAKQISAGVGVSGSPEVFEINGSNAVEVNRGAGFVNLGGYAKQISATMNDTVFVIGSDNSVFRNSGGSGYVPLGGYAKQISASLDAVGKPEVFAIGLDDALYVNHGTGFTTLGGFVTEVAAPGVSIALPGDVAYVVNVGHGAALHRGPSFFNISGGTVE